MYVIDQQAISAQKTHDLSFEKGDYSTYVAATFPIVEPAYAEFIPLNLLFFSTQQAYPIILLFLYAT